MVKHHLERLASDAAVMWQPDYSSVTVFPEDGYGLSRRTNAGLGSESGMLATC